MTISVSKIGPGQNSLGRSSRGVAELCEKEVGTNMGVDGGTGGRIRETCDLR